ncbi:DEAD/DEAH box helicase family protein [uncultured Succinivibrio sp.]|uniref:DEAD/DEAH box helicase family protein n=1 Tax=uncultured Succinivibrio sp. TaxID=540749 RepID=UPI0025F14AA3|nr:DEAD/DEAH box helicase family protein [uncultured Succinivibrio sp.]
MSGESKVEKVMSSIPRFCGVIKVSNNSVEIVKKACISPNVSIKSQLNLLWPAELRELLMNFSMPNYSQKDREYIEARLVENVDSGLLSNAVIKELMNRDYSFFEDYVQDAGLKSFYDSDEGKELFCPRRVYYKKLRKKRNPSEANLNTEITENSNQEGFLGAGNSAEILDLVIHSMENGLTLDKWIGLYASASRLKENENYKGGKRKVLEDGRKKHLITFENIEVHPGVPWVRREIIQQFVWHLVYDVDDIRKLGDPNQKKSKYFWLTYIHCWTDSDGCNHDIRYYSRFDVNYEQITGFWKIEGAKSSSSSLDKAAHADLCLRFNILQVLEIMLNLRNPTVIFESDAILLEQDKKNIQHEFEEWLWRDEDRKWEVEEAYNLMFAEIEQPEERERVIKYQELMRKQARNGERDCTVSLYPYQEKAVERIVSQDNTLLAFEVGAGKTYIMIAAAMRMRKLGISRKNLFVVPNNITAQWAEIFEKMYPKARLLLIDPQNFKKELRERTLMLARDGDFDGIIIAYSCFEQVYLSEDFVKKMLEKKSSEYKNRLDEYWDNFGSDGNLYRLFDNMLGKIRKLSVELTPSSLSEANNVTFDSLGIETIFVDEAHNYKNLPLLEDRLNYIKGLNPKGSLKCFDMLCKIIAVQQNNNGRSAVFATGTPLTNSISDTYVMQVYLQPKLLGKTHLYMFSNWLKSFGNIENRTEIDVNARTFRSVKRLGRFVNLPELSKMFSRIAIYYSVKKKNIPDFSGYKEEVLPIDDDLNSYMIEISNRSDVIRSGNISPRLDNMLKISSDGRKAALDLRLVDKDQIIENGKIFVCANKVVEIYNEYPDTSQLIFCDLGTPKGGCKKLNVYKALKEMLVSLGIKSKEIAFVHQVTKEHEKAELYEKVNNAEIRVLIGSTFKLGIGANVQRKLKAIHHLDAPWRPADMVQRNGRILRQGNENSEVEIYRYIREGSFDAYTWQVLENKQRFISQFLKGSAKQRTMKDLDDEVLSYAEVKALAHGDPRLRDLSQLENELASYQLLSEEFEQEISKLKKNIPVLKEMLSKQENTHRQTLVDLERINNTKPDDFKELRKKLFSLFDETVLPDNTDSEVFVTSWKDFKFYLRNRKDDSASDLDTNSLLLLIAGEGKYEVTLGDSSSGNAQRAVNYLKNLSKSAEEHEKEFLATKLELKNALERIECDNPYQEKVNSLEISTRKLSNEILNS